jgi:hypothetical protein
LASKNNHIHPIRGVAPTRAAVKLRRAYPSACGLSAGDAAFNEDTREQPHNIKLQEALLGLNVRQPRSLALW